MTTYVVRTHARCDVEFVWSVEAKDAREARLKVMRGEQDGLIEHGGPEQLGKQHFIEALTADASNGYYEGNREGEAAYAEHQR